MQFGSDTEWIEVCIDGSDHSYSILNVLAERDCTDTERSEFTRWEKSDGRADKVGEFRMFTKLLIDPRRCGDAEIFRLDGWNIALVVSERVRGMLEGVRDLGVKFDPIC